jgi:hypothetical protein
VTSQQPPPEGPPVYVRDAFRVSKTRDDKTQTAVCEVWAHALGGWELRLSINGDSHRISTAGSVVEMAETAEDWRERMLKTGWR